jgi:hypothetical protein
MGFVRSYGGAVKILQSVKKGNTSRNWVRVIEYSTKSPTKIKDMRYTPSQVRNLQKMIKEIKGKRISKTPDKRSSARSMFKSLSPKALQKIRVNRWMSPEMKDELRKLKSKSKKKSKRKSKSRSKRR